MTRIEQTSPTGITIVILPETEKEVYKNFQDLGWNLSFNGSYDMVHPTNKRVTIKISRIEDVKNILHNLTAQMSIVST